MKRKSYLKRKLKTTKTNSSENIKRAALQAIKIVHDNDKGYRGCGVYRVAIKDGEIKATLPGGYHDSCPLYVKMKNWIPVISKELCKHGTVVKADGSGCQFFLREYPKEDLIKTNVYTVPAPAGDGNFGYKHRNIEVL